MPALSAGAEPVTRDGLRQLCVNATPGPWLVRRFDYIDDDFAPKCITVEDGDFASEAQITDGKSELLFDPDGEAKNARFAAAARTAMPVLLDLADAVQAYTTALDEAARLASAMAPQDDLGEAVRAGQNALGAMRSALAALRVGEDGGPK